MNLVWWRRAFYVAAGFVVACGNSFGVGDDNGGSRTVEGNEPQPAKTGSSEGSGSMPFDATHPAAKVPYPQVRTDLPPRRGSRWDNDAQPDILLQAIDREGGNAGALHLWSMAPMDLTGDIRAQKSQNVIADRQLLSIDSPERVVIANADFTRDDNVDLITESNNGELSLIIMDWLRARRITRIPQVLDSGWHAVGSMYRTMEGDEASGPILPSLVLQNESTGRIQIRETLPVMAPDPEDPRMRQIVGGIALKESRELDVGDPYWRVVASGCDVAAVGDLQAQENGRSDLLVQNKEDRRVELWAIGSKMDGSLVVLERIPFTYYTPDVNWSVVGFGECRFAEYAEIILQNRTTREVASWRWGVAKNTVIYRNRIARQLPANESIVGL